MKKILKGGNAPFFKCSSTQGEICLRKMHFIGLILYFYPKDMTPGCSIQAKEFSNIYEDLKKIKIKIIGVSRDNLKKHKKFCEKENIKYPLLLDEDSKLCNNYGVIKEKSIFGKKYLGIQRTTFFIDKNFKIINIWENVKPKGHAKEVLDFIKKSKL